MNAKIEDNPSHAKMMKEIEGAKAFKDILIATGADPEMVSQLFGPLEEIESQFNSTTKSPDKFNQYFSPKGWIAHESMNFDLMVKCIKLAEGGEFETAEQVLINYYTSEEFGLPIGWLNATKEFQIRNSLIESAYEDTLAKRYHSCIPIILLVIDGAVNDIDKNGGFFAAKSDMTAWDSIAAHSSGLATLKKIFNESRSKTNTEEITMPYRHGILHGRDIHYATKTVTAKCWAALFAINDWAKAVRKGNKNPPQPEPVVTANEALENLKNTLIKYQDSQVKNKEVTKKVEDWKPRELALGIDIPFNGYAEEYGETPEKEVIVFLNNWQKKNYWEISKQIHFGYIQVDQNKEVRRVRAVFQDKVLNSFRIIKVRDCSPAITEVTLSVEFIFNDKNFKKEITIRLICEDSNGEIVIFGDKGGRWKFIKTFFPIIENVF